MNLKQPFDRLTRVFSASVKLVHNNWQEDSKTLTDTHDQDLRQCGTKTDQI